MSKLLKDMSGEDIIGTLSGNRTVTFSQQQGKQWITVDLESVKAKARAFFSVETTTEDDIKMVNQQLSKLHNLHLFSYELAEGKNLPKIVKTKDGRKSFMFHCYSNSTPKPTS